MSRSRVQIVLDADVIIHFSKGGMLSKLPDIFPNYDYVVLDKVHNELKGDVRRQFDNQVALLKNIRVINFIPIGDQRKEYVILTSKLMRGVGESACMVYCRYNHEVIGSSNLKDIRQYCEDHQITYLTTLDFLYYAIQKGEITHDEANKFIADVNSKDSKLPDIDMRTYKCRVVI